MESRQRRALIVAGAAGPVEQAEEVLARFGFAESEQAPSLAAAIEHMHASNFDLVIVPLGDMDAVHHASLDLEIHKSPSTFFIGTAPKPDPDLILRAMRTGVHEFLVFPPDPKELAAAVDRLMRRNRSEQRRGMVFAVYSSKGGLGNTSIAVNLAHALARNHKASRVALADLVVSNGDVRVMLDLKPSYDMGSLVEKLDRVDAELLYSLLTPHAGGVWALPGPDNPEYEDVIDATTVTTIIDHLRAHFAFTVLDCEHHISERTLAALDAADRVLLNTQMTVPALRAAQRALSIFQRLGYPDDKVCIVVNRFQANDVLSTTDAVAVLKRDVFWKLPNDYRTSAAALTKGVPVAEYDASSKLANSYSQLAAKLGGTSSGQRTNGHSEQGSSRLRKMLGISKRS